MTLAEYSAWFNGFSDVMPCPPGVAHWTKIKQRVSEIDGNAISPAHFHAHYRPDLTPDVDDDDFDVLEALQVLGRLESKRLCAPLIHRYPSLQRVP